MSLLVDHIRSAALEAVPPCACHLKMHSFRTTTFFWGRINGTRTWNRPCLHCIQVCPKISGLHRSIPILFGWDWKPQSNSREGSGFLGRGHWLSWNFPFFGESKNTSVWQFWGSRFPCKTKWLLSKLAPENWWQKARIYFLFGLVFAHFQGHTCCYTLEDERRVHLQPSPILYRKMIWTKPPGNYVPAVHLQGV